MPILANINLKNRKVMEKKSRLQELYDLARANGLVHSKGEFASLIGVESSTLSHALKDDGKIKVENVINRAEHALMKAGVVIGNSASGDGSMQNVCGSNNTIGVPPKKFTHEEEWFALVAEKDKQIEKLLQEMTAQRIDFMELLRKK